MFALASPSCPQGGAKHQALLIMGIITNFPMPPPDGNALHASLSRPVSLELSAKLTHARAKRACVSVSHSLGQASGMALVGWQRKG